MLEIEATDVRTSRSGGRRMMEWRDGQAALRCVLGAQRSDAIWEETSRRYDDCHPGDKFTDLVRRSSFSKEDRRLLEDWLAATKAKLEAAND